MRHDETGDSWVAPGQLCARVIHGCERAFLCPARGLGPSTFQKRVRFNPPVDFDQFRHDPGPSSLVTRANTRTVVAMEILIEL